MIPKAYQGKYLLLKEGGFASIKAVYDYSDYFEATSSNYIIHSKGLYTKPIVLKDTDADEGHSYNGKAILYYEDVNNPVTVFRFLTNGYLQKRQLFHGFISGSGPGDAYIHIDDINK